MLAVVVATWAGRPITGERLVQMLVLALPTAGIYALAATGLVVVYTTTGVFNFAQGAVGMLGALLYWQLKVADAWPTWIAVVITVFVFAPLLGCVLERLIMRHLAGKDIVTQLMVTVGLLLGLVGVANTIWDPNVGRAVPTFFGIDGFSIAGVILTWHRLIALVVAVLLVVGLRFLLYATRTGIAMRAVVDNRGLASLAGVPAPRVSMVAWMLGSTLAALAGVLIANETDMFSLGSLTLVTLVPAFAAAALGRMRSLPLTYLGAIILATAKVFSDLFLSFGGRWAKVPDRFPEIMLFVVLLLLPASQLRFARITTMRARARPASPRHAAVGLASLIVVVPIIGASLSATNLSHLTEALGLALVALSLVPLTGWAGQVSFAPLAFAGIGAAAFARWGGGAGHPWAILLGAVAAAPAGMLLSLIAVRLQGLYLGLATFAFAFFTREILLDQPFAFAGQTLNTPRPHWFGISLEGDQAYLTVLVVVFAIVAMGLVLMRNRPWGRRLVALRDSEAAAATVGINLLETKVAVFTLSAMIAGLGGSFLAMFYTKPSAAKFEALAGLGLVLQMVVGGIALVAGAVFAGVFQLPIQILLNRFPDIALLRGLESIAPGFAALGIIQNPQGAVVAIGEGFAPLLPGRSDARAALGAKRQRTADRYETESNELGLSIPLTDRVIADVERALGASSELVAERR